MRKLGLLIGALLFSGNLYALDTVFVEYGVGSAAEMARVGFGWGWEKQWLNDGGWVLAGSWELSAGTWQGRSSGGVWMGRFRAGENRTVTDVGVTPVFRLQQKYPSAVAPYLEGAIGFHLISPRTLYINRNFGSSFQFGDHVGVGVRYGEHQQFDLAWHFQHLSNGDIKQPNDGINFNQLRFAYHF